jgi:hypothetical protein
MVWLWRRIDDMLPWEAASIIAIARKDGPEFLAKTQRSQDAKSDSYRGADLG